MRRHSDRGQVTALVTVLMLSLLLCVGLVVDGGRILAARREADDVAANAARAGAQAVSLDRLRGDNAQALDSGAARAAAQDFLERHGYQGTVTVDGDGVTVTVRIDEPLVILGVVGMTSRTVEGTGTARTVRGIHGGET